MRRGSRWCLPSKGFEEFEEALEVDGLVVPHREVATVGADQGLAVGQELRHAGEVGWVHGVVGGADGEGGNGNAMEVVPALPVAEVSCDDELTFALHLVVNVERGIAEGAGDWFGPRVCPTDALGIELLHHDALVFGIVIIAGRFEAIQFCTGFLCQKAFEVVETGEVGVDSGRHVGDNEAAQVLLVLQGVFNGEHSTPGLPVEHEVFKAESDPDPFDLFAVAVAGPERGISGAVGVSAAKLVVVEHLDAGLGQERLHGFEVLVGEAGAAVQEQDADGEIVVATGLGGCEPLGPDFVLSPHDGNHADSCDTDFRRIQRVEYVTHQKSICGAWPGEDGQLVTDYWVRRVPASSRPGSPPARVARARAELKAPLRGTACWGTGCWRVTIRAFAGASPVQL